MNIMLIDDDDAVRMMLQDIIEDYDLGDVTASLPSALELSSEMLQHQHIDILIIDMSKAKTSWARPMKTALTTTS